MSVRDQTISVLRAEWVKSMVDSCTITRTTGRGVFNETTGSYDTPTVTQVYSGACRFRTAKDGDQIDFGQQQITEIDMVVELPYTATGIEPDDVVTADTSVDPELTGVSMRVLAVAASSHPTHRHVALSRNLGAGNP